MTRQSHSTNIVTNITTLSLVGITALSAIILSAPPSHAESDQVDVINITVPTACTMGGTIVQGEEHSTSLQPGTYESSIGKTTLTTYCNDPGGFSIYAIGFTGDVYTGTNHTKLVGNTATNTISTGLTTGSSTTDASSWAMKLSAVTGAYAPTVMDGTNGSEDFTDYHVVPDTYTKVATYGNTTDADGGTGSSLETTYAVYASLSQPADTYTGKVKYTLVHPSSFALGNYSVVYKPNGGTGTDVTISNIANYEPYTIAANTFTAPSGYQFAGWCTIQDNSQSPQPQTSCAGGTLYQPNDIATSLASAGGTFNLYATWSKLLTMQEFASSDAAGMNVGDSTTLIDIRDSESYTVTKLADNKVWMTTNLNLAGETTLSADDTDMDSSWTLPTTNGFQAGNKLPASSPTGTSVSGYYTDDTMAYLTNSGSTTCATNTPCYSYYSWTTATLGSGLSIATDNTDAPYSICPKGWHLPNTYNGSGTAAEATDFRALMFALGGSSSVQTYNKSTTPTGATISSALQADPYNFLPGGRYIGGSLLLGGSYGLYWSATSGSSSATARYLNFYSSYVSSAENNTRRGGFSVRCVFGE